MSEIKDLATQAVDVVVNNPKTAIAVPYTTAAVGKFLETIGMQTLLTNASLCLGVFISFIILINWLIRIKITLNELKLSNKKVKDEEA